MKISKLFKLSLCFYLPLGVFLFHIFVLGPLNIYTIWNWIDIPMHFIGGMSIAYSFILVLRKCKDEIIINDRLISIIILIALVGLSTIFWELGEFLYGFDLQLRDTLFDIFMGLVGGFVIALFTNITNITNIKNVKNVNNVTTLKLIERFIKALYLKRRMKNTTQIKIFEYMFNISLVIGSIISAMFLSTLVMYRNNLLDAGGIYLVISIFMVVSFFLLLVSSVYLNKLYSHFNK